jgi:hypothetical protein
MDSLETTKKKKIKEKITETEKQTAAFNVKDRRSGQEYEVVMDESGNKQILNREKKVAELENKIREVEKQEIAKKLSQEEEKIDGDKPPVSKAEGEKTSTEEINRNESDTVTAEKRGGSEKEKKKKTSAQTTEEEKNRIEYQKEIAKEKKQKIEKLWQEVEKNRKEYLEKDYENNTGLARVKNFFGSFLKKDKDGAGFQSEKELAKYRAYYDNSLLEHKKAVLEDAKFRGVSGKELLDIAKIYQVEANMNLVDIHDQVKKENQEGKIVDFVKEHSKKWIEKYNKLSKSEKITVGIAFGLAGAGAVYAGGATAMIVGSAIATKRILMGVITGTSVALGFEAYGKKKTAEKIQKEMEDLKKKMGEMSEEEKFKILEGFIDKDIQDEDRKIDKIKNKNLRHLAYGVAAGIAASGAWSYVESIFGDVPKGGGGGQNIPTGESPVPEAPEVAEQVPKAAVPLSGEAELRGTETGPEIEQTVSESTVEETEIPGTEGVIVEVQKGNPLCKIIGKQLEGYEGYADLNEAQKTYVIDALKDKVAANPETFGLENIDKLEIGQKIDLSEIFQDNQPENLITEAQDLNSEQMQSILENNQKLGDWVEANPGEELTSEKTAEILEGELKGAEESGMAGDTSEASNIGEASEAGKIEDAANASETSNIEEASRAEEIEKDSEASEKLKTENDLDVDKQEVEEPKIQFEKATKEPGVVLSAEAAHKMIEKSADKFGENIITSSDTPNFSSGQRIVSWEEMKEVKCSDIQLEGSAAAPEYIKNRLDKIMVFSKENFGAESIAKPNETLKDWLVRLTEKHGADKMENIFKLAK